MMAITTSSSIRVNALPESQRGVRWNLGMNLLPLGRRRLAAKGIFVFLPYRERNSYARNRQKRRMFPFLPSQWWSCFSSGYDPSLYRSTDDCKQKDGFLLIDVAGRYCVSRRHRLGEATGAQG